MKYLLLIATTLLTFSLSAQRGDREDRRGGERGERLEQQRIAYITTELDLTVEEAQKFWPIYNDYQAKKKEYGMHRKDDVDVDKLTEQEAKSLLNEAMASRKRHGELEVEFINNLENVLPAKKRLQLLRVEREFKKSVLKRFKKRMKRGDKRKNKTPKVENLQKEK